MACGLAASCGGRQRAYNQAWSVMEHLSGAGPASLACWTGEERRGEDWIEWGRIRRLGKQLQSVRQLRCAWLKATVMLCARALTKHVCDCHRGLGGAHAVCGG